MDTRSSWTFPSADCVFVLVQEDKPPIFLDAVTNEVCLAVACMCGTRGLEKPWRFGWNRKSKRRAEDLQVPFVAFVGLVSDIK